jgi:archaellum biogenesis protein FlaJ (TadC family)
MAEKEKSDNKVFLDQEITFIQDDDGSEGDHYLTVLDRHNDNLVYRVSKHQLVYSILGLILGLVCIIGGVLLFLAGVTGAMSWTAKFLGASSEIFDAAPGAVLFIVGLFVVFITRYELKSRR